MGQRILVVKSYQSVIVALLLRSYRIQWRAAGTKGRQPLIHFGEDHSVRYARRTQPVDRRRCCLCLRGCHPTLMLNMFSNRKPGGSEPTVAAISIQEFYCYAV